MPQEMNQLNLYLFSIMATFLRFVEKEKKEEKNVKKGNVLTVLPICCLKTKQLK